MFVGFAMQTLATAATPDSVFVVKNGRIVSAYEVGTDVDNISFPKRIQLDGNCVKVGDDVYEMKSAVVTTINNYKYIYLSTLEGCKTPEDVMKGGKNLQLAFSPTLLDKYVEFNAFGHDFDADKDFFQAVFMDVDEYNRNDDYEPVSVSSYDWNDYYSDGLLQVSFTGGKLALNLEATPKKGETLLAAQYNGAYTEVVANENHFIVYANPIGALQELLYLRSSCHLFHCSCGIVKAVGICLRHNNSIVENHQIVLSVIRPRQRSDLIGQICILKNVDGGITGSNAPVTADR